MRLLTFLTIIGPLNSRDFVSAATTNVIVIGAFPNYSYSPKVVSIQAGDRVIWTGLGAIHTATGDTLPETLCGATFPGSCTNVFNTAGRYLYHCVNHVAGGMTGVVNVAAVALPPTVSITNPAAGTTFASPASVKLFATAASTVGSVTNVQFFSNGGLLGAVTTSPFTLNNAALGLGSNSITAKAIATTGLSSTSAPVNLFVVNPVALTNFSPRWTNSHFVFDHNANPGLHYVVQQSTNFVDWSSAATNMATSNSVEVDTLQIGNMIFYRVGRLPNP